MRLEDFPVDRVVVREHDDQIGVDNNLTGLARHHPEVARDLVGADQRIDSAEIGSQVGEFLGDCDGR